MAKQTKKNLLMQGTILATAGIITRLIGLIYRIPMANMLGDAGNGIYSVAFGIYNITLTLSSYSLPLAVSKLISQRNASKEYKNAYHVFRDALLFGLVVGSIACALIYFGADFLEVCYAREGLAKPLQVVAPTTFIMAILGVFRGLFQGKSTMIPTALSQIFEQIVNAIISVLAVYTFMKLYSTSAEVSAYGAAGGIMGTFAGAFTALLFLVIIFLMYRPVLTRQMNKDQTPILESNREIYRALFLTIIPIALSQTVYQLGYTLDDLIFGNVMQLKGMENTMISSLQGAFNSQYNLLINLPVAIASSLAASTIPNIAASVAANRKRRDVQEKVESVIKFNMVVAFPSAVGLAVLARPILEVLFPNLSTYRDITVNLLLIGSSAVIFYSLSTITSAILQGVNQMKIPIRHAGISLIIHLLIVIPLLTWTDLSVYALVIGNITFPLVVCILNWHSVEKHLQYKQEVIKTFLVPFTSSIVMGAVVFSIYQGLLFITQITLLSLLVSIIVGIMVYGLLILLLKCFSEEDLNDIPFGRKIATLARKLHIKL